ncbi:MAG: response regulator [Nitrospira sp.]|nr:response regulator [Nitrospira sp.]
MIAPQPVPAQSSRRLRRRYAWLMLALGAPVLAAAVYALVLQYRVVMDGHRRQLVSSAERNVTQFDAVLGRMREDMLRLGITVRSPGLLTRGVEVDKRSLGRTAEGIYSLDALPAMLRDAAPQIILAGAAWSDVARRDAAVERAALFAEQAQLALLRGGRFSRVTYVDVEAGEVWIYPWVASSGWLAQVPAASLERAGAQIARRLGLPDERAAAIEEQLRWQVRRDATGQRQITLATTLGGSGTRFLVADVHPSAFERIKIDPGIGRFWVLDGDGQVAADYVGSVASPSVVAGSTPLPLPKDRLAAALGVPLAVEIGPALVAARSSAIAPWVALHVRDRAEVRRRALHDIWPHLAGSALLLALFAGIAVFIWQQFGKPSLRLVDFLRRQAADPAAWSPQVPTAWLPWLHLTRDTFAAWREAAAREQKTEALKSAIVDHALAAVVTADDQGRIVEFNPAAQRMFARTREEMIGQPAGGIIVPQSLRDDYLEDLRRVRQGDAARLIGQRVEVTALRPDGTPFPVEMVLWRTRVGDETFFTASMYDLSERHAAREEIERQRDALRQAEKLAAMGSLLAGVAHELNNPLAIVLGRASLLEAKCADPALRGDASRIREAAERCGRIVRTFLAMARKRPVVRGPVQLNDLVRGAVELLQYNLRTAGVAVELQLQTDLPAVVADADQLGQLLLNLIVNAQQSLALAEPPRRMRIETGSSATGIWLRVADNGVGVSEASRERIFDAFVTTKPEGMGTGLGLAVARSVAREHGGDVWLEAASPFGRGASFRLDLPLQPVKPDATPRAAAQGPVPAIGRVLVVDDEPEVAAMMRDALEVAGYEVAAAESGAVALALLDEARFDVVVSDLRMPDMDGRALWRAVRERHRELAHRFIFVTGDTLSPLASEFRRESGAEGLEKPFTATDLVQRVQRCVRTQPAHATSG